MKQNFTFCLLLLVSNMAWSQWSDDPNNANDLVVENVISNSPFSISSDSAGGAYIMYFKSGNAFVQHVNSAGIKTFASAVQLSQDYGANQDYQYDLLTDNSGNLIAAYYDLQGSSIYMQKIDINGNKLWNLSGVVISNQNKPFAPYLVSDGNGGAFCIWRESDHLLLQNIKSDGNISFEPGGKAISSSPDFMVMGDAIDDGNGGAIIIYNEYADDSSSIKGQRVDKDGNLLWGANAQLLVSDKKGEPAIGLSEGGSNSNLILNDGNGNIYFAYEIYSTNTDKSFLNVQKIGADGNLEWNDGITVYTNPAGDNAEINLLHSTDGVNIFWVDEKNSSASSILGQGVTNSGKLKWKDGGIEFGKEAAKAGEVISCVNSIDENTILSWQGEDRNLYAQKINNETGSIYWGANGKAICTVPNSKADPEITYSYPTGAIIAWDDYRNPPNDIYINRAVDDIILPVTITDFSAAVQDKNIKLSWRTTEEINFKGFYIERMDNFYSWQTLGFVTANKARKGYYEYIDTHPENGDNAYRLKGIDYDGSVTVSEVKNVNFNLNSIQVYPNPVNNIVSIRGLDCASSPVTLKIIDLKGKVVKIVSVETNNYDWNVSSLAKGIYYLQIIQSGKEIKLLNLFKR